MNTLLLMAVVSSSSIKDRNQKKVVKKNKHIMDKDIVILSNKKT